MDEIQAIRRGHSPNCSATGSVVGLALVSAAALALVVNSFADRFTRWRDRDDDDDDGPKPKVRRERRGSLLAWPSPPALLKLGPAATEAALAAGATEIGGNRAPDGALSAPVEVHVALTNRCPVACTDCYLDAGPDRTEVVPELDRRLEELAAMGVFEVALGGGEGLYADPEGLLATARRIRELGMVPNLTTSGFGMTADRARQLRVMGQVNISLDGLNGIYADSRGFDGTTTALRAIDHLVAAGVRVGVNTVISRTTVPHLEELAEALVAHGVSEWQWLRLKPAGRASAVYADRTPIADQLMELWPRALALSEATPLEIRFDCALVPFLVAHQPPLEHLERLAISGCPGGIGLMSIGADGQVAPCSFAHDLTEPAAAAPLDAQWASGSTFTAWRDRAQAPPEPCGSCPYRTVCRGGCRGGLGPPDRGSDGPGSRVPEGARMDAVRGRVAAAAAWAGIAGASSYALQRLYSAWSGEVGYANILAQEHVPYYWRAVLALFHAVLVGLVIGLGSKEAHAERILGAVPAGLVLVTLLAIAMGLVP